MNLVELLIYAATCDAYVAGRVSLVPFLFVVSARDALERAAIPTLRA